MCVICVSYVISIFALNWCHIARITWNLCCTLFIYLRFIQDLTKYPIWSNLCHLCYMSIDVNCRNVSNLRSNVRCEMCHMFDVNCVICVSYGVYMWYVKCATWISYVLYVWNMWHMWSNRSPLYICAMCVICVICVMSLANLAQRQLTTWNLCCMLKYVIYIYVSFI